MQKTSSVLLGALVIAVIALVVWWAAPKRAVRRPETVAVSASAVPIVSASADAGRSLVSLLGEVPTLRPVPGAEGPGTRMLDGSLPPPLPDDAPKSLRFGVVLVQYRGAQRAGPNARPRTEALELAKGLAVIAQTDFKSAVEKGDSGSVTDAGRIPANVLEPAPNYVLFSLPVGGVGGPVDTPTGYWVIKNLGK